MLIFWGKKAFLLTLNSLTRYTAASIVYPTTAVQMINATHYNRQRFTACLAILAVLLLFIAPMVSKNLAENRDAMAMSDMSMMDQHNDMIMADMPMGDHHSDMAMGDHSMMMSACGYCDLLVHIPFMLWVFIPFIWLMCLISRAPPTPDTFCPLLPRHKRVYRQRAPPLQMRASA